VVTGPGTRRVKRVLCVRLDSLGDVLVSGPAVRAVAAAADEVVMLVGPAGAEAAELLPGVSAHIVWRSPWILTEPPPVAKSDIVGLVERLQRAAFAEALIFTSFHQSPLPMALLLRLADVKRISAISVDYPGSLLDVRHRVDEDLPEPERALSLAVAAGFAAVDGTALAVRRPLPDVRALTPPEPYVVVHPGASVPSRRWPAERHAEAVQLLRHAGWSVVVTGTRDERQLTSAVAGPYAVDLGGRTTVAETAAVLDGAAAVIVGNTGPAHLSAAVGTPVVSLFSPVVPAVRWAPYGVPHVLLGDQAASCKDTRARECPVPGHPCLSNVTVQDVLAAVEKLAGVPS
jgi:ADP-heptose:LPS heptosyltransferase